MNAPIKRGCGYRKVGGAYFVTGLSAFGRPVEDFIIEPKKPLNPEQIGLSAIGVMPFKKHRDDEITHAMNWVGEEHYPNPADFIEEVRRYGASTRVSKNFRFDLMSEGSYVYHVHAHAWIENWLEYAVNPPMLRESDAENPIDRLVENIVDPKASLKGCPKANHSTESYDAFCARYWWQDIAGGDYLTGIENDRSVRRKIGDTTYYGFARPVGVKGMYKPAMFCRFPVHRIEVIKDPKGNTHEDTLEKAWYADVEVRVVDF